MRNLLHTLGPFLPFLIGQFGFDFGDVFATLESFLGAILDFILQIIQLIWQVIVAVANFIFSILQFVWNFLTTLFADISKAFKWIWQTVIKGALTKLVDIFVRVRTWLQKIFGPVLHWLQVARKWFDWAFNKYVKPVLVLIQKVRQFLTVFRILGFKWAAKLDAMLAKIQQDILKVYTKLRAELNQTITWLQLIIDPFAILRRNPVFARLINSAPELKNLMLQVDQRPLSASEIDEQDRDKRAASLAGQKANFQTYYSQGKLTPDDEVFRGEFNAELDSILNP